MTTSNTKTQKGYNLERYCVLTLEYNGWHVKRNALSYGIEDVIAFDGMRTLIIQVKNTKKLHNSMTKDEQNILKLHADEINAIPIYLYKKGRGKFCWFNLSNNSEFIIDNYTKKWYLERQTIKQILRKLNKQSKSKYNKYVLENWDKIKDYIC